MTEQERKQAIELLEKARTKAHCNLLQRNECCFCLISDALALLKPCPNPACENGIITVWDTPKSARTYPCLKCQAHPPEAGKDESEFVKRLRKNCQDKGNWSGLFGAMLKDDVLEACDRLEEAMNSRNAWQKEAMRQKSNIKYWKAKLEAETKRADEAEAEIALNSFGGDFCKCLKSQKLQTKLEAAEKKCDNCVYLEADGEILNHHIEKHNAYEKKIKQLQSAIAKLKGE